MRKESETSLHILCSEKEKMLRSSVSKKATGKKTNKEVDEILESGLHGTIFCCKLFLSFTLSVAK